MIIENTESRIRTFVNKNDISKEIYVTTDNRAFDEYKKALYEQRCIDTYEPAIGDYFIRRSGLDNSISEVYKLHSSTKNGWHCYKIIASLGRFARPESEGNYLNERSGYFNPIESEEVAIELAHALLLKEAA